MKLKKTIIHIMCKRTFMMINVIVHIYNIITTIVLHTSTKNTTTCKKPKILHKTKNKIPYRFGA